MYFDQVEMESTSNCSNSLSLAVYFFVLTQVVKTNETRIMLDFTEIYFNFKRIPRNQRLIEKLIYFHEYVVLSISES